jgi:hypothetical protein
MKSRKWDQLDGTIVGHNQGIASILANVDHDNRTILGYRLAKLREWGSTKKVCEIRNLSDATNELFPSFSEPVVPLNGFLGITIQTS